MSPHDHQQEGQQPPGFLAPRATSALQAALSYGAAFGALKESGLW